MGRNMALLIFDDFFLMENLKLKKIENFQKLNREENTA